MKLYRPDAEDFHVYGGMVLVGVGLTFALWGLAVVGAMLWYLRVFRVKGD
jgi:hypothetical protein